MKQKFRIRDLCYMSLSAALIAVCSWISIPSAVPFTLQTFAVFSILGLLGGQRGTVSVLVYILLGAVGLPVFSGFRGGIGVLLGTTGGYIAGFLLTALLYWLTEKQHRNRPLPQAAVLLCGLLLCYAFGTAWFMTVYTRTKGAVTLGAALSWCVFPFILPDMIKLAIAVPLSQRLRKLIPD